MLDWQIPYLTADLPGVGGAIRVEIEDFIVEEVPAYEPCGEGEHTFFGIEKRGIATQVVVKQVAQALGVPEREISRAGLKDARAVARQTLCAHMVPPERLLALELDQASVLWAKRHTNKLRSGHLKGNRFCIRIRNPEPEAEPRAQAILECLTERGVPNGYGVQRFGNRGTNHEVGLLLLRNDREGLQAHGIRHLGYTMRAFFISALQSALFNQVLAIRIRQGTLDDVLPGDVAKKTDTGGIFTVEDAAVERPRVKAWAISPTGPIFGYKMWPALAEAGMIESHVLESAGLTPADFRPSKSQGTRRPLRYRPEGLSWRMEADSSLVVSFFAPEGAFATMLLRELMKFAGDMAAEGEDSADDEA
ncbi:MAG: tRNA pseudouridine(13) synthase TruD [Anaerolineae bacterium]|nr:tRNA pseudouridine(13) synthase TruD [Anaerolineae bacterium]